LGLVSSVDSYRLPVVRGQQLMFIDFGVLVASGLSLIGLIVASLGLACGLRSLERRVDALEKITSPVKIG
jgi:hypothetical protein